MHSLKDTQVIHADITGEGSPVLLIHGLAGSHHDWDMLVPILVEEGYKTYCPDLLGHGDSAKPDIPEIYTVDNLYQIIIDWIDHVGIDKPFYLVGHSLGGHISLLLAAKRPELISKMILVAPFYSLKQIPRLARTALEYPEISEKAISMSKAQLVYSIITVAEPLIGKYPSEVRWQTANDYVCASPATMRFPATAHDLSHYLADIHIPTLVIWGKNDLVLSPNQFPSMVEKMPNASAVAISGSGHEPHLTEHNKFNEILLNFLRTQ
jgi:pimeloyl-ACP methyl ester carboxylesterase